MRRQILSAVLGLLAVMAAAAGTASADPRGPRDEVRLNELQVIGTHNSYHREISEREQAVYDAAINTPGDYDAFLAIATPRCHASSRARTCAGSSSTCSATRRAACTPSR